MQNTQDTGMGGPPGTSAGDGREGKRPIGGLVSEAKQEAGRVVEGVKAQAMGAVDERKGTAADQLGIVAEALREAAHKLEGQSVGPLGAYAEDAAGQVEKVARYLRERDVKGLTRDAETFARRHPELFLGGAFLAGMLVARFVKSSGQRSTSGGDGRGGDDQAGFTGGYGDGSSPAYGTGATGYSGATGYESGASGYGTGATGYGTGPSGPAGGGTGTAYPTGSNEPFNAPHFGDTTRGE